LVWLELDINYVIKLMFGFSYCVKTIKRNFSYRSVYNSLMYNWDEQSFCFIVVPLYKHALCGNINFSFLGYLVPGCYLGRTVLPKFSSELSLYLVHFQGYMYVYIIHWLYTILFYTI